MKTTLVLTVLVGTLLATFAAAQTSGRHFHRDSRLPATPPAATKSASDATATTAAVPLRKLRSGRPWPRHHFGRLPAPAATPPADAKPIDAAHDSAPPTTQGPRGFWRERR
jgi:hypothetical protein